MSWLLNFKNIKPSALTDTVKRKVCGFVLRRYGGSWLKEKQINLDQLTFDLYNGLASFKNFELDVEKLNELLEENGISLEIADCYIGSMSAAVPWSSIFSDNSVLDVSNLEMTIRYKARSENSKESLCDSKLFKSMTSSMKLAEECLKKESPISNNNPEPSFEGLQELACAIEAIFVKVKINLTDVIVSFEHFDKNNKISLELRINKIEYFDDEATIPTQQNGFDNNEKDNKKNDKKLWEEDYKEESKLCDIAILRIKNIVLHGISLHMNVVEKSKPNENEASFENYSMVMSMMGKQEVRVKMKREDGPTSLADMEIDNHFNCMHIFLSPFTFKQLHIILNDILEGSSNTGDGGGKSDSKKVKMMDSADFKRITLNEDTAGVKGYGKQTFDDLDDADSLIFYKSSNNHVSRHHKFDSQMENSGFESMLSSVSSKDSQLPKNFALETAAIDNKSKMTTRISFVSVVLLHQDPRSSASSMEDHYHNLHVFNRSSDDNLNDGIDDDLKRKTQEKKSLSETRKKLNAFKLKARDYFKKVDLLMFVGVRKQEDVVNLRKAFSSIVSANHFCLLNKLLNMEVDQRKKHSTRLSLSLGLLDLVEAIIPQENKTHNEQTDLNRSQLFNTNKINHSFLHQSQRLNASSVYFSTHSVDSNSQHDDVVDESSHSETADIKKKKLKVDYCKLLVFTDTSPMEQSGMFHSLMLTSNPCLRLSINHTQKNYQGATSGMSVEFRILPCSTELDLTIINRLITFLKPTSPQTSRPLTKPSLNSFNNLNTSMLDSFADHSSFETFKTQLFIEKWSLYLRFPKLDLRKEASFETYPGNHLSFTRQLHKEIVSLGVKKLDLKLCFKENLPVTPGSSFYNLENIFLKFISAGFNLHRFNCGDMKENKKDPDKTKKTETKKPHVDTTCVDSKTDGEDLEDIEDDDEVFRFINIGSEGTPQEQALGFGWPFLKVVLNEDRSVFDRARLEKSTMADSIAQTVINMKLLKSNLPFSNKKVMYDNEEVVRAGDRKETASFHETESLNSRLSLSLNLPNIHLLIPNKLSLELLYNRFLADLALWEPPTTSDDLQTSIHPLSTKPSIHPFNWSYKGFPSTNFAAQEDDEEEEDDDDLDDDILNATFMKTACNENQNKMSFSMNVSKVHLVINLPTSGSCVMNIQDVYFSFIYAYHGDPNFCYLCSQINKLQILNLNQKQDFPIFSPRDYPNGDEDFFKKFENHNLDGVSVKVLETKNVVGSNESNDALSLTLKIKTEQDQQLIHYKVAVSMRYFMLHFNKQSIQCISQLTETFTLLDYEIPGYQLPQTITELHLQFFDSSLFYKDSDCSSANHVNTVRFKPSSTFDKSEKLNKNTVVYMKDDVVGFKSKNSSQSNSSIKRKNTNDISLDDVTAITSDTAEKSDGNESSESGKNGVVCYSLLLYSESVSISSNIVPDSCSSRIKFLIEDLGVFISDKQQPILNVLSPSSKYVCVLDLQVFDLEGKQFILPNISETLTSSFLPNSTDPKAQNTSLYCNQSDSFAPLPITPSSVQHNVSSGCFDRESGMEIVGSLSRLNIKTCCDSLVALAQIIMNMAEEVQIEEVAGKDKNSDVCGGGNRVNNNIGLVSEARASNVEDISFESSNISNLATNTASEKTVKIEKKTSLEINDCNKDDGASEDDEYSDDASANTIKFIGFDDDKLSPRSTYASKKSKTLIQGSKSTTQTLYSCDKKNQNKRDDQFSKQPCRPNSFNQTNRTKTNGILLNTKNPFVTNDSAMKHISKTSGSQNEKINAMLGSVYISKDKDCKKLLYDAMMDNDVNCRPHSSTQDSKRHLKQAYVPKQQRSQGTRSAHKKSYIDEKPVCSVFNNPDIRDYIVTDAKNNRKSLEEEYEDWDIINHDEFKRIRTNSDDGKFDMCASISEQPSKDQLPCDPLKAPDHFPPAKNTFRLEDVSIIWSIYGGNDFGSAPSRPSSTNRDQKLDKKTFLGWRELCGKGRNQSVMMQLVVNKLQAQHQEYRVVGASVQRSRDVLVIKELVVNDRLVSSDFNKFLHKLECHQTAVAQSNMIVAKSYHLQPEPGNQQKECKIKVTVQPIKLNIDQDSLQFLYDFFMYVNDVGSTIFDSKNSLDSQLNKNTKATKLSTNPEIAEVNKEMNGKNGKEDEDRMNKFSLEVKPFTPIYFSDVSFTPSVVIKIDYQGKGVALGSIGGFLAGFIQLECSEITLKSFRYRRGILGVDRLLQFVLKEWINDIKNNQIPGVLAGVGPVNYVVQIVQGLRDLFLLPLEHYRSGTGFQEGMRLGTLSFAECTLLSALELTNKFVRSIKYIAEAAHSVVTYDMGGPVTEEDVMRRKAILAQPQDVREGVSSACNIIKHGMEKRATDIYTTVRKGHEQKGFTGALGSVLRQLPPTLIEPILLTTEATSNVIGGLRNQLVPNRKKEDEDKYKGGEIE